MISSKFIIHDHRAQRAGNHWDIRFEIPNSKLWASFACRKDPSLAETQKLLINRTNDHSEVEALMTGTIISGYGAGTLKVWDKGMCTIEKYSPSHIVLNFKGKKIKGLYHMIRMNSRQFGKGRSYLFFKGKIK
jgi:DNA ligase D-like protein (predicted 3'-phosphoesterase)